GTSTNTEDEDMTAPDKGKGSEALERVLKLCGDNQSELARRVGVKQPHVWKWLRSGRVPAERVPAVVRAVAGAVQAHELRPDLPELFPVPLPEEVSAADRGVGERRSDERRQADRRAKAA